MRHTFFFAREEGIDGVTAAAVLTIDLSNPVAVTHVEVFERFTTAVTEWLRETDEGREAWEQSSYDFNIGDFVSGVNLKKSPFVEIASRHGLVVWEADTIAWDHMIAFDRILRTDEEDEG